MEWVLGLIETLHSSQGCVCPWQISHPHLTIQGHFQNELWSHYGESPAWPWTGVRDLAIWPPWLTCCMARSLRIHLQGLEQGIDVFLLYLHTIASLGQADCLLLQGWKAFCLLQFSRSHVSVRKQVAATDLVCVSRIDELFSPPSPSMIPVIISVFHANYLTICGCFVSLDKELENCWSEFSCDLCIPLPWGLQNIFMQKSSQVCI